MRLELTADYQPQTPELGSLVNEPAHHSLVLIAYAQILVKRP